MTAQEWKEKSAAADGAEPLELPSGMVIRARRPGPLQLAAWDRLPMLMDRIVSAQVSTEEMIESARFMRDLLMWCCVEPRVSMEPAPDAIEPREIAEQDWQFIVAWAMRLKEADAVRPFRGERTSEPGGGDGQTVRGKAERADGDRRSGGGPDDRPGGRKAADRARGGRRGRK